MVYAQLKIRPRKWDAQNPLGFWDTNGSSNLGQTTRPCDSQKKKKKKKKTGQIVDFSLPVHQKVKLKENEKSDKYRDLAGELKKL